MTIDRRTSGTAASVRIPDVRNKLHRNTFHKIDKSSELQKKPLFWVHRRRRLRTALSVPK
jgi:hypothetical protein